MSNTLNLPPNLHVPLTSSQVQKDQPLAQGQVPRDLPIPSDARPTHVAPVQTLSGRAIVVRGAVPIAVAADLMASIARAVAATHLYNDNPPPLPPRVRLETLTVDANDIPYLTCVDAEIDTSEGKADLPDWESTKLDVFRLARLFAELLLGEDLPSPGDHGLGHCTWLDCLMETLERVHPVLATRDGVPSLDRGPGQHLTDLLRGALAFEVEDRPALDGFADELDVLAGITPGPDVTAYLAWIRAGGIGPAPTTPAPPRPYDPYEWLR